MRDLDYSLNFNFSRGNSNGWHNFHFDDASQDISILNKNHQSVNPSNFPFHNLLSDPPRPASNIYNCIQSEQEEHDQIKQVEYLQNEPEAKHVNSKQYFRMMKRRIKKVMNQFANNQNANGNVEFNNAIEEAKRKGYLYESRHLHAQARARGKDGKFLATRPEHQRFRQKKKRGRKPKVRVDEQISTVENKDGLTTKISHAIL